MTLRRVGILGGMGPEATLLIMRKLLDAVPATDDADHIPLIVDQNPQVPSRIQHILEGTGKDPGPVLAQMAARLQQAGAEALALPCNTAHHYARAIRGAVTIPFLDMVDLSVRHAAALAPPEGRVGILASPAVARIALFEPVLARHGLTAVYPDDQAALLAAIRQIKVAGATAESRRILAAASGDVLARGAMVQMVACTELSLIAEAVAEGATTFDTLDCLVRAIVDFAKDDSGDRKSPADTSTGRLA